MSGVRETNERVRDPVQIGTISYNPDGVLRPLEGSESVAKETRLRQERKMLQDIERNERQRESRGAKLEKLSDCIKITEHQMHAWLTSKFYL